MSGKLFAVVVIVIALASAVPILNHTFMGANVSMPQDISTHGFEIDKQIDETMIEAGLSFLAGIGRRAADSGAGRAIRVLFPLCRARREVRGAASRENRRGQREFLWAG